MTDSTTSKLTYKDQLLSEHLNLINKNASEKMVVPIHFTQGDLADLFTLSSKDLITGATLAEFAQPVDVRLVPTLGVIKEAIDDSTKQVTGHISQNALTMAFSMMGYASSLGRKIECAGGEVNMQGQFGRRTDNFGEINSKLFREFESDPITGAQTLFNAISEAVGHPDRMIVMAVITPRLRM